MPKTLDKIARELFLTNPYKTTPYKLVDINEQRRLLNAAYAEGILDMFNGIKRSGGNPGTSDKLNDREENKVTA